MSSRSGLTILEVLIALVVVAVAFVALAYTQLTNLKVSSNARLVSEAKTVAVNVLEDQIAKVLTVDNTLSPPANYLDAQYDDNGTTHYESFHYIDYYYSCPSVVSLPSGVRSTSSPQLRSVTCDNQNSPITRTAQDGAVSAVYDIKGLSGPSGEGVITISVTATLTTASHQSHAVTVADSLSCYDVYPSPKVDTPAPCPIPTKLGGGR